MGITWTKPAVADLKALRAHIAAENPQAAGRVAATILESVERLTAFPASGRPGQKPDTRELVIPGTPYFIVYRVRRESVEILRVIHGSRRWP